MYHRSKTNVLAAICIFACSRLHGEVIDLNIHSRVPFAEGKTIGNRGAFEVLRGTATFAIDPKLAANRAIVDLELAPLGASGKVEFSADVEMTLPVDRSQANGAIFYDVNNRGNPTAGRIIDGDAEHFLLRQGFVFVASGWIAEVHAGENRLTLVAPEARENGQPVYGIVRNEIVVDAATTRTSVSDRPNMGSYRPSKRAMAEATLTVRERESDTRTIVPRDQWQLVVTDVAQAGKKQLLPLVELELPQGFTPGWIYEIVYEAEGAIVQGAGMAGIRDLISFLKHDSTPANPLRESSGKQLTARAIGFGTSQSGRLLRQFVYEGFNADEQGRKVFDGVIPHVAGGALGSFNHRFASPTRTNGQHDEHLFPADYFPFTYGDSYDPYQNRTDGILRRARENNTTPKVFHTQSSSEYWHRSGSLVHTDPLSKSDAGIPAEVRLYTFGGTQHGTGNGLPTSGGNGQQSTNPADYKPFMRALVMAMDAWIRDGVEPPPSVYPRIDQGTLVGWKATQSGWPTIPGVRYPTVVQQPHVLDRGPLWAARKIASIEPPIIKEDYTVRVPAYSSDGNERGTLNLPAVVAAIATYTSWNMRSDRIGAPGELLGLQGSYIPFARTEEDRRKHADPRPALLERYTGFADYQQQFMAVAHQLVAQRYILAEDLPRLKALSEHHRGLFEPSKN